MDATSLPITVSHLIGIVVADAFHLGLTPAQVMLPVKGAAPPALAPRLGAGR